jgi:hypothetical protein
LGISWHPSQIAERRSDTPGAPESKTTPFDDGIANDLNLVRVTYPFAACSNYQSGASNQTDCGYDVRGVNLGSLSRLLALLLALLLSVIIILLRVE